MESEWRLLVKSEELEFKKDMRFMKAPILSVISDMVGEDDRKLCTYCQKEGIPYKKRKCSHQFEKLF